MPRKPKAASTARATRQHGTRYVCAMPNNLYGPGDNYDLQTSHVLPVPIRKFHEAKVRNETEVTVWGTGTPRREFLYSDDMADACIHLLELPNATSLSDGLRLAYADFKSTRQ